MSQQTPMSMRLNRAFDGLRIALSKMDPDYAELVRQDLIMLLAVTKVAYERYSRKTLSDVRATVAPRHLAWVAVGLATKEEDEAENGQVIMWSDRAARIMNREERKKLDDPEKDA